MKKIISIMLLVVLAITIATPTTAYACSCTCPCCKKKSTASFTKQTNALLKPAKSYAKKYGWTVETKVVKKTAKKVYTDVHFVCDKTHRYMDVTIRATKSKSGKITAEWWFKDYNDGKWKRTGITGIKSVLKRSGSKK